MNIDPQKALADTPRLMKEWETLSLRMRNATGIGFEGDVSPEELHGASRIERALRQVEEAGRALSSNDPLTRSKAVEEILAIYECRSNGLRADLQYHTQELTWGRLRGTEPFAYSARLLVAAATTIAEAARQANNTTILREIEVSVEAAASGLTRTDYAQATALSKVLLHHLSL